MQYSGLGHPKSKCSEENDFIQQREATKHPSNGMILNAVYVFYYQCDVNGDYKPMQRHAGTGERWCVNPKTGVIIEGTNRSPTQPDPGCEGGKQIKYFFEKTSFPHIFPYVSVIEIFSRD